LGYKPFWLVVEPTPLKNEEVRQLGLPSGKRLQKKDGKSPCFMGKSTISMALAFQILQDLSQ